MKRDQHSKQLLYLTIKSKKGIYYISRKTSLKIKINSKPVELSTFMYLWRHSPVYIFMYPYKQKNLWQKQSDCAEIEYHTVQKIKF